MKNEVRPQDSIGFMLYLFLMVLVLVNSIRSTVYWFQNPEKTKMQVFYHIWLGK